MSLTLLLRFCTLLSVWISSYLRLHVAVSWLHEEELATGEDEERDKVHSQGIEPHVFCAGCDQLPQPKLDFLSLRLKPPFSVPYYDLVHHIFSARTLTHVKEL